MLSPAIRFCQTRDGVRLAYTRQGAGAPLVRAAHFLTHIEYDMESPVWRPWIDALSQGRQLLRYDGRNCGLSDDGADEPSLDAWVADLEAVVDAAGLERFTLLGCSQGCAISIAYAVHHPERVNALILFGGYLRGLERRRPDEAQQREARLLLDLVELGWGSENPAFRQVYTSLFIPGGSQEQVRWFNELQRRSATPANALRTLRAVAQIDVSGLASQIPCPTLVLHSCGDARVPFEEGRLVAGAIPEAQFMPLESRNHVLLQDEPAFAACMGHIRDFMDRHEPSSSGRLQLTPREAELLELLAHGLDNLQIAAHLRLAEKTVRNKVSAVFDKLQVETRAQAIVKARLAGYGLKPLPR